MFYLILFIICSLWFLNDSFRSAELNVSFRRVQKYGYLSFAVTRNETFSSAFLKWLVLTSKNRRLYIHTDNGGARFHPSMVCIAEELAIVMNKVRYLL